jgi:hypothetical protein
MFLENNVDRATLEEWALTLEKFDRLQSGKIIGGVVNTLHLMNDEEIELFSKAYLDKYPALKNHEKLNQLVKDLGIFESRNLSFNYSEDRKTLEKWAYALEKYDREQNGSGFLIGGIVNTMHTMNDDELLQFVINHLKNYTDLNAEKLNKLYEEMDFLAEPIIGGGIHEIVYALDRETLMKWALAAETYNRQKRGVFPSHGVHE